MSQKRLIVREILARREEVRGTVLTEPRLIDFDPAGSKFAVWVVDVDVGGNRVLEKVPVKINGPKARFYARAGSPVILKKDAQGRYQVVAPSDRQIRQGNVIEIDEDTSVATAAGNVGFTAVREPYQFYKGITPESFFDPALDGNTLLWLRTYDRLTGKPSNIEVASDVDGAEISRITDKSGNGASASSGGAGLNPLYRKFDATGGNANNRSSADFDGSNDGMPLDSNVSETTPGSISIFALVNKDATGAGDDLLLQLAEWRVYSRRSAGDTWAVDQGAGLQDSTGTITSNFTLIELVAAGFGSLTFYQDGTLLTTLTPGGSGLGLSASFLGSDGVIGAHDGRVVEVLVMDEAVDATKRQAIEAYFNQTIFVNFSRYNNGVDGYPKIRVLDADGNEVTL